MRKTVLRLYSTQADGAYKVLQAWTDGVVSLNRFNPSYDSNTVRPTYINNQA